MNTVKFKVSFLFYFAISWAGFAQNFAPAPVIYCDKGGFEAGTQVRFPTINNNAKRAATSQIDVTYIDFPENAKVAFEYAVSIWEEHLVSSVPINIKATWTASLNSQTLASSSASRIVNNFTNSPYKDVWYVIPLAESLSGKDLNSGDFDININLNRTITWNYDIKAIADARSYDMVSIVLHEIAHGLGFSSSMKLSGDDEAQWGQASLAYIYDLFIQNGQAQKLVNTNAIGNPSVQLKSLLTSDNLFFDVFELNAGEVDPKIQASSVFESGKSTSHLDEATYRNGNSNSLMTPNIGQGEVIHIPGNATLQILKQMGWSVRNLETSSPLSLETIKEKEILIFPNPTQNLLNIYLPASWRNKEISYQISDITGKSFISEDISSLENTTFSENVAHLYTGNYFIKFFFEGQAITKRFVKL